MGLRLASFVGGLVAAVALYSCSLQKLEKEDFEVAETHQEFLAESWQVVPELKLSVKQSGRLISRWGELERKIKYEEISPQNAIEELPKIIEPLKEVLLSEFGNSPFEFRNMSFPIVGSRSSIGGNGDGYRPNGFTFFDASVHLSHAAHDIFVNDQNQDTLDDITKKPIEIISIVPAIVLSTYEHWLPSSKFRGGNCVWMYNPLANLFLYYAHLNSVYVTPGEYVAQNQKIGTVGRSGKNAFAQRSSTHLHLMTIKYDWGKMTPYNYLPFLLHKK